MNIQHLRIARPTDRLDEVVAFYCDLLDFSILTQFDHEGFAGVILGRQANDFHLEFTHEHGRASEAATSPEHLIVLYLEDDAWNQTQRRLASHGIVPVPSHNPYWDRYGVTIEDPDGCRIVLHNGPWRV